MQPIFLKPVFKQTLWGGTRLRRNFGYDIPGDDTGECWAISSHPNGDCVIASGEYQGMTLSALWDTHRELFGNHPGDRFPLLVKLIDAQSDLSIQVHPDDAYAMEHENGSLGKTECWYILDCKDDAEIVIGHHAKDRREMEEMIRGGRWNEFLRTVRIHRGDFFQIEPGTIHSIKGTTLLLETQQNSDITYRVYDYDRVDSKGNPRELHLEQSINVIKAPFVPDDPHYRTVTEPDYELVDLVSCQYYSVNKLTLHGTARFVQNAPFRLVSVIDGKGAIDNIPLHKGDHFILPAGGESYTLTGNMTIISSSVPA